MKLNICPIKAAELLNRGQQENSHSGNIKRPPKSKDFNAFYKKS
jgi:hypothetical protein